MEEVIDRGVLDCSNNLRQFFYGGEMGITMTVVARVMWTETISRDRNEKVLFYMHR